jgi:hypothetical protein
VEEGGVGGMTSSNFGCQMRHSKYLVEIEERARIREKRLVEAKASPSIIVLILRFSNSFVLKFLC